MLFRSIENIYKGSLNDSADPKVRQKFANTLELIRTRHTLLIDTLIGNNFDLNALATGIDWADWNGRVGAERGFIRPY